MKHEMKGLLIIAAIMCLSGCARVSIVSVDSINKQEILGSSVGVAVMIPNKQLEFSEAIYKVLYYNMEESFYSFDGLWDPSKELTRQCMDTLQKKFDMKTVSLASNADSLMYKQYEKENSNLFNASRQRYKGTASSFLSGYALESIHNTGFLTTRPNENILKEAEKLNLQYVMEIQLTGVSIYSHCFNLFTNFHVYAYARLISVPEGKVIWADQGTGYTKISGKITLNDLKAVDRYYNKSVANLCNPDAPTMVGQSMVFNSYLFSRLVEELIKN